MEEILDFTYLQAKFRFAEFQGVVLFSRDESFISQLHKFTPKF